MFTPMWGFPALTNATMQQFQHELEQMHSHFDQSFQVLLNGNRHEVGQTPAEEVYQERRLRLLHYTPLVESRSTLPILLVPSPIQRAYLLDLMPGQSLVEYLLKQGLDVYLLDWGTMNREDRFVTFDQHISGYIRRAVNRIRARSGSNHVSLLGYSMGGTMAAIFAALYPELVNSLVLLSAPINFHDDGLLSQWSRKERLNVDLVVDTIGAMPNDLLLSSYRMLKPTAQIAQRIALAQRTGDLQTVQDFLAMQNWMDDIIPFIGEAYRKWMKEFYQENALIKRRLVIDGRLVDLAAIICPLLTITAAYDCFCPPLSTTMAHQFVASGNQHTLQIQTGHIGVVAGKAAADEMWPQLSSWLLPRSTSAPAEA
jgi:polyhydroxyalkanoate synthase